MNTTIVGKNKKRAFQYVLDSGRADALCPSDCEVVSMPGYSRMEDYYLFVPREGLFFRSANSSRYGEWRKTVFLDGRFVGACPMSKTGRVRKLYEAGHRSDAEEYALGHRLWRETELGGGKINARKEAARISHAMCDIPGRAGHDIRQAIRMNIREVL